MSDTMNPKVGDTLYRFDGNRRVYRDCASGPVYREHFEPLKIIGENRASWLLEHGWKASKKDLKSAASMQYGGRGFFTKDGMEGDIWMHENRFQIMRTMESATLSQLRKIAEILEYKSR